MPAYTYFCPTCNAETEIIHPIDEKPAVSCPKCGTSMRIHVGAPYIVWGTGFTKQFDWGWKDDTIVSYPDGRCVHKSHNEMYEDGGL